MAKDIVGKGNEIIKNINDANAVFVFAKLTSDDEFAIQANKKRLVSLIREMVREKPEMIFEAHLDDGDLYLGW